VELYRWLGEGLKSSLKTLKPPQLKELEDAFVNFENDKRDGKYQEQEIRCLNGVGNMFIFFFQSK
jgi:hypothetical protein